MKKQLAMILMLLPLMGHAQTAGDTTFVYGNKQIVVNDTDNRMDITVLTKDGDEYKKTQETTFVDGKEITQVYVTSPFFPNKWTNKKHQFYCHLPTLSYGYSPMLEGVLAFNGSETMHSSTKSWEVTITIVDIAIPLNAQNTFGLSAGLQVAWGRHHFAENYGLYKEEGIVSVRPIDALGEGERLKKSYLSYKTVRFPVVFEFQNVAGCPDLFATIGPSLEFRFDEHSRIKTNYNTITPTKNININPIGVNLEAQVGYEPIAIFMRTALTPLMRTNAAPKAYPMSMGIALTF